SRSSDRQKVGTARGAADSQRGRRHQVLRLHRSRRRAPPARVEDRRRVRPHRKRAEGKRAGASARADFVIEVTGSVPRFPKKEIAAFARRVLVLSGAATPSSPRGGGAP